MRRNIELRNQEIKKDYREMASRKKRGVQMYTHDYICLELGEKYFLQPLTIERIVIS